MGSSGSPRVARRAATLATALSLGGCCTSGPGRPATPPQELEARAAEIRSGERFFRAVPASPFLVVGDGFLDEVRAYADDVVSWAAMLLRRDFFPLDPADVVEIWVFRSEESYYGAGVARFGSPASPYGYYAPCRGALVINAALGAGTLVHEMVHPLMEANFPEAPTWLDEGLGSLFEQPRERDGHLVGGTNWRLPALQQALRDGHAMPLAELVASSRLAFYGDDSGLYYATARYLLFYLQERGRLVAFYERFHAGIDGDQTGGAALLAITGEPSLEALDARWRSFTVGLAFP